MPQMDGPRGGGAHGVSTRNPSVWGEGAVRGRPRHGVGDPLRCTVTVRRDFSSTMDQPVCLGETRALAARALNDIRRDYNSAVALVPN
jgi:hypothetical protein